MALMLADMPQEYLVMVHLSLSVVDGGRGALKTEVAGPRFVTQGVSRRRDRVYYLQ